MNKDKKDEVLIRLNEFKKLLLDYKGRCKEEDYVKLISEIKKELDI